MQDTERDAGLYDDIAFGHIDLNYANGQQMMARDADTGDGEGSSRYVVRAPTTIAQVTCEVKPYNVPAERAQACAYAVSSRWCKRGPRESDQLRMHGH